MKNILLITNLYPSDDVEFLNNTSVCHYFAREWLKLGYNVRVVHNYNLYPKAYYPVLRVFRKFFANKYGIAILDQYLDKVYTYNYEGVKVTRIPIRKTKPGGDYLTRIIDKQVNRIQEILASENFIPDIITGHFIHPNLEILSKLKNVYSIPVAISLHGELMKFSKKEQELFNAIDYVGFRSYAIKRSFERFYGPVNNGFMCPSGVPDYFIEKPIRRDYKDKLRIIYVGNLISRKHPISIVQALLLLGKHRFQVEYVGEGIEQNRIIRLSNKNNSNTWIKFSGRIPRQAVVRHLDSADIFIMISEHETFGLVYLEAMARGCIVVASSNEGMDGIIEHGVNGFLCEAGNAYMLANILERIQNMSLEELSILSNNSRETVKNYTDKVVAKQYLRGIHLV